MKVPGRKMVVRMAMIFIEELSRLLDAASFFASYANPKFKSASCCEMRLNSCELLVSIFPAEIARNRSVNSQHSAGPAYAD